MKKYYDHDEDWQRRQTQGQAIWGSQSPHVYRAVLALIQKFAPPTGLVVDAGCGAGAFGLEVLAAGYDYLGIEDSAAGVALGKSRHPEVKLLHHDLVDPLPAGWPSADVAAVTSINVLHCLLEDNHRRAFLKNLKRLSGSRGILVLTTMAGPPSAAWRPSKRPRRFETPEAILTEVQAAGFSKLLHQEVEPAEAGANVPNLTLLMGTET